MLLAVHDVRDHSILDESFQGMSSSSKLDAVVSEMKAPMDVFSVVGSTYPWGDMTLEGSTTDILRLSWRRGGWCIREKLRTV